MYKIAELFGPTIQGEGTYAGCVADFLRFAGCNRHCTFCDTNWLDANLVTEDPSEVLEKLPRSPHRRLIITGGEPLLQLDRELLTELRRHYHTVHIETNGSIEPPRDVMDGINHISCSPKQFASESKLTVVNDLKVIWPLHYDEIENYTRLWPFAKLFIQPIWDTCTPKTINELIEVMTNKWSMAKLSIQQHKLIGVR